MVMTNRNGRIEMVNVQAERVFGYPREEMIGQLRSCCRSNCQLA